MRYEIHSSGDVIFRSEVPYTTVDIVKAASLFAFKENVIISEWAVLTDFNANLAVWELIFVDHEGQLATYNDFEDLI